MLINRQNYRELWNKYTVYSNGSIRQNATLPSSPTEKTINLPKAVTTEYLLAIKEFMQDGLNNVYPCHTGGPVSYGKRLYYMTKETGESSRDHYYIDFTSTTYIRSYNYDTNRNVTLIFQV